MNKRTSFSYVLLFPRTLELDVQSSQFVPSTVASLPQVESRSRQDRLSNWPALAWPALAWTHETKNFLFSSSVNPFCNPSQHLSKFAPAKGVRFLDKEADTSSSENQGAEAESQSNQQRESENSRFRCLQFGAMSNNP
jgi:hypothetical protein